MPALVQDPRLPVISFTGSEPGRLRDHGLGAAQALHPGARRQRRGRRPRRLRPDADLDWAATRIATFSNYQAGQSCISVQRVIADASVYDRLLPRIVAAVEAQVTGDPADDETEVGPLVSEDAAERVEPWVDEAVAAGATLLTGGKRDGATYAPTVLADVPADAKVSCEEVFGPVLTVQKVDGEAEAFAAVNDSKYGLQAGVFTRDLQTAFRAHRALEVGGVIIGDVPSYRADQMPYGGVKQSGVGREGVRFAMEDYTYERVLVLTGSLSSHLANGNHFHIGSVKRPGTDAFRCRAPSCAAAPDPQPEKPTCASRSGPRSLRCTSCTPVGGDGRAERRVVVRSRRRGARSSARRSAGPPSSDSSTAPSPATSPSPR